MMFPEPPLEISVIDGASVSGAAASPSVPQLQASFQPASPLSLKPLAAFSPKSTIAS
jgi:hypothetical protein